MVATITAVSPDYLSKNIIQVKVNGISIDALIETSSSSNYINFNIVNAKMFPLFYHGKCFSASQVIGYFLVSLHLKNILYRNIKLLIIKNLYSDRIQGHDFLQHHSSIEIPFGDPKPALSIASVA